MSGNAVMTQSVIENQFESDVQIGLKNSYVYQYKGKFKELCILFKSLGIYNFFDQLTVLKSAKNNQLFIPDDDYKQTLAEILNCTDDAEIFKKTEEYFLERHAHFSHPYLEEAINKLEFTDGKKLISVDELSKKLNITRQTLANQFKKYLNLSPAEFRQISRFRTLIQSKIFSEKKLPLTEFVYEFGFFRSITPNQRISKIHFSQAERFLQTNQLFGRQTRSYALAIIYPFSIFTIFKFYLSSLFIIMNRTKRDYLKNLTAIFLFFASFTNVFGQIGNPNIITSDIDNFWIAYDKITATKDRAEQLDYINDLYIEKGSPGLKAIMQARRYTDKSYIDAINDHPLFWKSIRANTLKSRQVAKEIEIDVAKIKKIYPVWKTK